MACGSGCRTSPKKAHAGDGANQLATLVRASQRLTATPRSGLDCDGLISMQVLDTDSVSPGYTGLSQRISSTPGEPMLAALPRKPVTISRIITEQVIQPLEMMPP